MYIQLTPPSPLVLEVTASGVYEALTWMHNDVGNASFSLSNFGQVLRVDRTVEEDAGEYTAALQGTVLPNVVFQVHPFSEFGLLHMLR